jgi:integrase
MRGRKGSRTEWNVHFRASDRIWVLKFYGLDGRRHDARIPREKVSDPEDREGAMREGRKMLRSYSLASSPPVAPPASPPTSTAAPTVAELGGRWRELREKSYREGALAWATIKQDRGCWTNHILPVLGDLRVNEVRQTQVREVFGRMRVAGYDGYTIRNVWSVMKTFFDDVDAEEWFDLPKNPARHKKVMADLPALKRPTKAYLKVETVESLLRCPYVAVVFRIRYLLAVLTGLRDGELAGLRFADVVRSGECVLRVRKQVRVEQGGPKEAPTKTATSNRDLPLADLVAAAIEWWWNEGWAHHVGRHPQESDLLLPNVEGEPWRPRSAEQLRYDLHLAGLSTRFKGEIGFVFHRTRGTFATWLARNGTPYDLRRHLLGHGAVGVTDGKYEEQEEQLPEHVAKLRLNVTLQELTHFAAPPEELRLEARRIAKETANKNVFSRRKKTVEANKFGATLGRTPKSPPEPAPG